MRISDCSSDVFASDLHMAMFGMKDVARPIKVRRHGGNEVTTVLLAIGLTEHDATDLRNRIPLICRFERAGQERLFAHRLRRFSRVDAGGAQKKKQNGRSSGRERV